MFNKWINDFMAMKRSEFVQSGYIIVYPDTSDENNVVVISHSSTGQTYLNTQKKM